MGVGVVGFGHAVRRQAVAVGEQGGAADVFQSAVDVVADVEQEEVMGERGRGGEHGQFGFADCADV